jgi:putative ABC transport system permease protein
LTGWLLAARLAARELRGGIAGFRIFLASLALGVAAIAAVGMMSEAVTRALAMDAALLLGGDVEVQLVQRFPSAEEAAVLRSNAGAVSTTVEMRAMAAPEADPERRTLVELKAVDAAYPLLGEITTTPPLTPATALAERDGRWGALVEPALLETLGTDVGDRVRVGDASFEVRAAIEREPDRVASIASFGPRMMIAERALAATGLVQPGSLLRHNTRVRLPDGVSAAAWTAAVRSALPQAGWQIRDPSRAAPGIERFVQRLALFLGFAGLTTLLIGGLGVANAVRHYLAGKLTTIATLKCLGAPAGLVAQVYLLQIVALAGLGTALGILIGTVLPLAVMTAVAPVLPVPIALTVYAEPILIAAALGLLTALTFSLWPLGSARETPAADLFRQGIAGLSRRPRMVYAAAAAVAAISLATLTILSVSDRLFGAAFVTGVIVVLTTLRLLAGGLITLARRLPGLRQTTLRLALAALRRPAAPTAMVVTSLGAGLTALVAVALIDTTLRAQIEERLPDTVPAFFFIDIQEEQAAAFDAAVRAVPGVADLRRLPVLRGRIVQIAGVPVEEAKVAPEAAWAIRGDRAFTSMATLPDNARIVAGTWWQDDYAGPPLISFDAGLARGFGVGVGDTLTVNILGRDIVGRIASLREIDWRAVPFDFALIFSPHVLTGAPYTHIAAVQATPEAEPAIGRALARGFPNITTIRTREAIATASRLMTRIGWSVLAAAAVTLAAGALVLAGTVAADHRRRSYEAVLFKVLGASRRRITGTYLVEYGLLGLTTAVVAAALGTLIAWAVSTQWMGLAWTFRPEVVAGTAALAVALTLAIGHAGTWRLLGERAARHLRND